MKRWLSVLLALAVLVWLLPGAMPQADAVTMDYPVDITVTATTSSSQTVGSTSYFLYSKNSANFFKLLYYLSADDLLVFAFHPHLYDFVGLYWDSNDKLCIGVFENPYLSNEPSLLGVYPLENLTNVGSCEVFTKDSNYPIYRSMPSWTEDMGACFIYDGETLSDGSVANWQNIRLKGRVISAAGIISSSSVFLSWIPDTTGYYYFLNFSYTTYSYEVEDPETPDFTILFRDADIWKYEQGEYGYYYIMSDTPLNGAGTVDFYINGAQVATQDVVVGATGFWYCEYALPTDQIGSYEVYAVVHNTLNGAVASATAPTKTVNIVEAGSSGGSSGGTGDSGGSGSGTTDGSLLAGIDYMLDELWQNISGAFADLGNKLSSWWNRLFGDLGDIKELLGNQSGGSDSAQLDEIQDAVDDVPNQVVDGMGDLMEQEKNNATVEGDSNAGALLDSIPDPSADMTGALNTLVSVLSYEGTAAVLTTPRVYLPAMNNVTQEVLLLGSQEINFEEYIALMPSYVIALIQALFDVAIVGFCLKELIEMVQLLASGVQKNEGS